MEKKQSLLQFTMTNGAILGIILILISLFMYIMNIIPDTMGKILLFPIVNGIIVIVFISITAKNYRDKVLDGFINYWNAFSVCLLIIVFASILSSFYALIFNTIIDPAYMDRVYESLTNWAYDLYSNMGLNESQIETAMERFEQQQENYTPLRAFFSGILNAALFGGIISLIVAAFIKKNPAPFEQQAQ